MKLSFKAQASGEVVQSSGRGKLFITENMKRILLLLARRILGSWEGVFRILCHSTISISGLRTLLLYISSVQVTHLISFAALLLLLYYLVTT